MTANPVTFSTIATNTTPASTSLLTAEEFFAQYEHKHAELVEGIVKELPMPTPEHGYVCLNIGSELRDFVRKADCGRVMSNDSFVVLRQDTHTVRGPDVSYYSYERIPKGPMPDGLLEAIPELVVEVRSPSNSWTEMFSKVSDYLKAGIQAVVILDIKTQTASVYRPDMLQETFHADQELTISEMLPGFSVLVGKLFE